MYEGTDQSLVQQDDEKKEQQKKQPTTTVPGAPGHRRKLLGVRSGGSHIRLLRTMQKYKQQLFKQAAFEAASTQSIALTTTTTTHASMQSISS